MNTIAQESMSQFTSQNKQISLTVDDSWIYSESSTPKNQNFDKPILWVADINSVGKLAALFDVVQFDDAVSATHSCDRPVSLSDERVHDSADHYLIVEKHTPEEVVKVTGWRLKASGFEAKVYRIQTSLDCLLLDESGVSLSEVILQIIEYAIPFSEWEVTTESKQLSTREATNIASSAIAHLPEPQKSVELATLRKRCGESSYDWNRLVGTLEEEFAKEQRNRTEQHLKRSYEQESVPEAPFGSPSKHLKRMQLIQARWGDRLRFNEMLQRLELDGKHLKLDTIKTKIAVDFNMDIAREDAIDILFYLAATRSYHPVRDYLDRVSSLHPDIDTSILDNIASRYFGNDSPIANIYMKKTLIGAVARIMEPGSKMDTITILYGKQGTFKSTFWRKLVGNEFFTDSLVDLTHKDELAKLQRFWGLELAEIDYLFGQKAVESFKRFLSAQDDTYRPPYGRENNTIPRTCFFVGTTNKKDLLNDPTGDRRYWVLDVMNDRIPYELLDTERDQLWAAAYLLYRQGERWDLSESEKARAHTANEDYRSVDPWEDAIANYLLIHPKVTTQEIMTNVLKLDLAQNDQQKQRRVVGILQRLGCESKTISCNGKKLRAWVYTPTTVEGNALLSSVTANVTHDVTVQTQLEQAVELTVTPVTTNIENFSEKTQSWAIDNSESNENDALDNSGKLIETDVTAVTGESARTENPCTDSVFEGNATPLATEETVLPEVTALLQSEWMSEENLQSMANDLEACDDIEMLQLMRSIYDKRALDMALTKISQDKCHTIRQWIAQLDTINVDNQGEPIA